MSSEDITVRENEKVTLVCNVTGVPPAEVTWYRHLTDRKGKQKQSEFCPGTNRKISVFAISYSLTCPLVSAAADAARSRKAISNFGKFVEATPPTYDNIYQGSKVKGYGGSRTASTVRECVTNKCHRYNICEGVWK